MLTAMRVPGMAPSARGPSLRPAARSPTAHRLRSRRTAVVGVRAQRGTRTADGGVQIYDKTVDSSALKGISILSSDGARMSLAEVVGGQPNISDRKAVVIFLRHLGWPYCWTYANEWSEKLPELSAAGVVGPVFISVGDQEKLNKFLELNPKVPRSLAFVDDSATFEAYAVTGFGNIGKAMPEMKLQPPGFDFGQWMSYLMNVMSLSPVPKDMKLGDGVPEGVLKLGGVFVLEGDAIVYAFAEPVPGQHAPIEEVLKAAGVA